MAGFVLVILVPAWQAVLAGAVLFISWSAISLPATLSLIYKVLPQNKCTMGVTMHSLMSRIPMALGPLVGGFFIGVWGETTGVRMAFGAALAMAAIALVLQQRMIESDAPPTDDDGDSCELVPDKNPLMLFRMMRPAMKRLLVTDILIRFCEQIPYAFVVVWWQVSPQVNLVTAFAFGIIGTVGFAIFGQDLNMPEKEDYMNNDNTYAINPADIALLRNAGVSEDDIDHSVAVAEKALEIAGRISQKVDAEFVGRGALFHDLGKAKTHEIDHGRLGAEMGAKLGLPNAVNAVMEKHIRGGLSEAEARELGLPIKDYTLHTLEERIIIYADRLVDIITEDIVPIVEEIEAETRFEEILRTIPKYGKNEPTMARYFGYHKEIQSLMNS